MGALANIRYRDEPVSFDAYGVYAVSATGSSAVRELLATLAWLGPHATSAVPNSRPCARRGGLPAKLRGDVERALQSVLGAPDTHDVRWYGFVLWPTGCRWRRAVSRSEDIDSVLLEDHAGDRISFNAFFRGQPSIVVFFYTRCDNPLKCSLPVAKLARLQQLLAPRVLPTGYARQRSHMIRRLRFACSPSRLWARPWRPHGRRPSAVPGSHRQSRPCRITSASGVNYVGSLVNRHRIELHILDAQARIAASFERLRWDEREVVARAVEVLKATNSIPRLPIRRGRS